MNNIAIGVGIGGSPISCAACDLSENTYLSKKHSENKINNHVPVDEIIGIWAKTISETLNKVESADIRGIGFAMPGPFDYFNGIAKFTGANKKFENLNELDVPRAIREALDFP